MVGLAEMNTLLPWCEPDWMRIQAERFAGKLPHALLVTGAEGVGKGSFVEMLAASLLCVQPAEDGMPCGCCQGCRLRLAGTHPDYRLIAPEEAGKPIKVDHIREFIAQEGLTAQAGGYKVIVIAPADALNQAAANSLLKTLEEPVPWTLMILVSAFPGRLPATIRSRCRQLRIALPARKSALEWLRQQQVEGDPELLLSLASGAPLRARELADPECLALRIKLLEAFAAILQQGRDPVAVAAAWSGLDVAMVLNWYSGWLIDCLRLRFDSDTRDLINPDQRKRLQHIGRSVESRKLFALLDSALEAVRSLGSQLNTQLMLEGLLLELAAVNEHT